jgi:hypothetical protein
MIAHDRDGPDTPAAPPRHPARQLRSGRRGDRPLAPIALPPTRAAETGASAKVADFLLAWWNGDECGHFPVLHLCNVDAVIAEDMLTIMAYLAQSRPPTPMPGATATRCTTFGCAIAATPPRAFKRLRRSTAKRDAGMIENEDEAFADNYAERDQAKALREQARGRAAFRGVSTRRHGRLAVGAGRAGPFR